MKAQLELNFYLDDVMYAALDDNNQPITHDFPEGTVLPKTATVFEEVQVPATKLKKKEPETLHEMGTTPTSRVNL